jgi:hypothetical protein
VSSSRSVTFDIAETTTHTGRRLYCSSHKGGTRIFSAEPIEVPPNFITTS